MSGINFGGLMFTFPVSVHARFAPPDAGIFAIQVPNATFNPLPYEPIYFGQGCNLTACPLTQHRRFAQWILHQHAHKGLFVSFFPTGTMPETTRLEFAGRLLAQYLQPWDPRQQAHAAGLRSEAKE